MVVAVEEGGIEPVEIAAGSQPDGVAQQGEVQVGTPVELQLSGILARKPRLGCQVVVQGVALLAQQLAADAQVVLRPAVHEGRCRRGVGVELRHLEAAQFVGGKSLEPGGCILVEAFEQGDGQRVAQVEVACLVVDGVARVAALHGLIIGVGIEVGGRGISLIDAVVARGFKGVDEAGDGHELALHARLERVGRHCLRDIGQCERIRGQCK